MKSGSLPAITMQIINLLFIYLTPKEISHFKKSSVFPIVKNSEREALFKTNGNFLLAIGIFFFTFFSFCTNIKEKKSIVRIGVPPRVSFLPIYTALEKGIFKKNGVNVDLVLDEKVNEMYMERKLDIICTGLTEPILFSSEGHNTQIVYRFSYSIENDIIIANPKIKNLESLFKKKVGFDGVNTSSHIFVQQLLSKKGISEGEYYAVNVPVNRVMEELEKGTIDAGHTNGISISDVKKKGWNIIGRSADDPDLLSDTLSVDTVFLKNHSFEVEKIIASIIEARELYATNPAESIAILANKIGKKQENVKEELSGVRFLSLRENIQSLKTSDSQKTNSIYPQGMSVIENPNHGMNLNLTEKKGALFTAGETIISFLRERGQLYKMPILESIINDKFVNVQKLK